MMIGRDLAATRLALGAFALGCLVFAPAELHARQAPQQDVTAGADSVTAGPRKAAKPKKTKRATRRTVSRGEIAAKAPTLSWTSPHGVESLASDLGTALSQHTR